MIAGNTGGQAISLTEDTFYLKITAVSGTSHGWVRVERNRAHLWEETSDRVAATVDPAFEINGGTGTVGQVYKAWRHPGTGEVLFFLRGSNSNLYPGCFVYYQFRNYVSPNDTIFTMNFPVNTIQGLSPGTAGMQAFIEWDAYAGKWREYGLMYMMDVGSPYINAIKWYADNGIYGNVTLSPEWKSVGEKGLVYDQPSALTYAYENTLGDLTRHGLFDIKKTCFSYNYQNTPQVAGGSFYYWYNQLYGVSITGQNRLSAFGTWLNGSNYYQYLQTNKQQFNPSANSTGSILIPVNNLTWTDSNGNTVSESFNYNLAWSTTPQSGGNITISYTGHIPDGPNNANGSPNPGGNITGSGLLPVRTTAGTSSVTMIDPVFNLPPNVTASYFDSYDFSRLTIIPWPQHNLIKVTFLNSASISGGNATYPIEIGDLAGRYCYGGAKGSGSQFVISGFTKEVNLSWFNYNNNNTYTQKFDYRVVSASLASSANQTASDASGTAYDLQLIIPYTHNPAFYNAFGTPVNTTYYTFRATTPKLANTIGANVTANFVQQPVTGAPYQNITLGSVKVELIDI